MINLILKYSSCCKKVEQSFGKLQNFISSEFTFTINSIDKSNRDLQHLNTQNQKLLGIIPRL